MSGNQPTSTLYLLMLLAHWLVIWAYQMASHYAVIPMPVLLKDLGWAVAYVNCETYNSDTSPYETF